MTTGGVRYFAEAKGDDGQATIHFLASQQLESMNKIGALQRTAWARMDNEYDNTPCLWKSGFSLFPRGHLRRRIVSSLQCPDRAREAAVLSRNCKINTTAPFSDRKAPAKLGFLGATVATTLVLCGSDVIFDPQQRTLLLRLTVVRDMPGCNPDGSSHRRCAAFWDRY